MVNFTSNTYQMKREILSFSNKISKHLSKPDKKFSADMTYGMLAAGSCLLTDVVEQLHEDTKKVNSVERLTRHLNNGTSFTALKSYLTAIRKWAPQEPVIYIDDSDVVKPDGYKFEALGLVRDGSKSTASKTVYEKGYHVTEACVLTKNNHPVSIFSKIHSSKEKNFTSNNDVTFSAMERGAALFGKATFAMDRGYDDNKMFLKLDELQQDYNIVMSHRRNTENSPQQNNLPVLYNVLKLSGILLFSRLRWFRKLQTAVNPSPVNAWCRSVLTCSGSWASGMPLKTVTDMSRISQNTSVLKLILSRRTVWITAGTPTI